MALFDLFTIPTFTKPGQAITNDTPAGLGTDKNMRIGFDIQLAIDTAKRYFDDVYRGLWAGKNQTGATISAELSGGAVFGGIGLQKFLALTPVKILARDTGKGRMGRAMKFTTHGAVTMRDPGLKGFNLKLNRAAQATSGIWNMHDPDPG